jgi:multiple sugar transport system substrate-binding protein
MVPKGFSRREFLLKVSLGAIGVVVASCGPASTPGPTKAVEEQAKATQAVPEQTPLAPREKVTVKFMVPGSQQEDADFKPVFDAFAEKYPDINGVYAPAGTGYTPEYDEKLMTMLAGGVAPDVFKTQFGKFGVLGAMDVYLPLDDYVAAYPEITQFEDFFENHVQGCRIQGKLMALPNDGAPEAIWYNVDLFEAEGIEFPDWDWTWDTMTEAARRLTKKEGDITVQYGVGHPFWLETIWSNGGEVISEDGKKCLLDSPEAVEALTWMQDLVVRHKVSPGPQALSELSESDRFTTGKLGAYYGVRGALGALRSIQAFDFDAAPMLKSNKGKRVTRLLIGWTSIWKGTKHPDEAYKLAAWICSPEGQRLRISRGYAHPSRKSLVQEDWYKNYKCDRCHSTNVNMVFPQMLLNGEARAWPPYPKEGEILRVVNTQLDHLWDGSKSAEQVAKDMTAEIDQLL